MSLQSNALLLTGIKNKSLKIKTLTYLKLQRWTL